MHPPIMRCKKGHNYCYNCYGKYEKCPLCEAPHSSNQDAVLKKMHNQVKFPCKHKKYGCLVVVKGKNLNQHERNCTVKLIECPEYFFGTCAWSGTLSGITEHCISAHPTISVTIPTVSYTWDDIERAFNGDEINILVFAYNTGFRCILEGNKDRSIVLWSMWHINISGDELDYTFHVQHKLVNPPANKKELGKAPVVCYSYDRAHQAVSIDMNRNIKKIFGEDTELSFILNIRRTNWKHRKYI